MGQYYRVVNLDKKQFLRPHAFGNGAKLMEFGSSAQGTMTALAVLLASGNGRGGGDARSDNSLIGSWAGDRIVITGDYADEGLFVTLTEEEVVRWAAKEGESDPNEHNLYSVATVLYEDISDRLVALLPSL